MNTPLSLRPLVARHLIACLALSGSWAFAQTVLPVPYSAGTSLGSVTVTGTVVFDTDPASGGSPYGAGRVVTVFQNQESPGDTLRVFDFASFTVAPGGVVRAVGSAPLVITCGGDVVVDGTIDVSGGHGEDNPTGGAGGGGGGGAVALFATGQVRVGATGRLLAKGGNGGVGLSGSGSGAAGTGGASGGAGGDGANPTLDLLGAGGGAGSGRRGHGGGGGGGGAYSSPGGPGGGSGVHGSNGLAGSSGGAGMCPDAVPGGAGGVGGGGTPGGPGGAAGGGAGSAGADGGNRRAGGGGGGGGGAWGGVGGSGGQGGKLGGGGGAGGAAETCTPSRGGLGAWGGNGGGGGDPSDPFLQSGVNTNPSRPNGGAGGGGCLNLGALTGIVRNDGQLDVLAGDSDGQPGPDGGNGVVYVYGTLSGTGSIHGPVRSSNGKAAADWLIDGGAGGGGSTPGSLLLAATVAYGTGCPAGAPLTQSSTRPVLGTTALLTVSNIPNSSLAGVQIIGNVLNPGIDLTFLGMPGCQLNVMPILVTLAFPISGSSASTPVLIPNDPSLTGAELGVTAATISPGANAAGILSANGVRWTLSPH